MKKVIFIALAFVSISSFAGKLNSCANFKKVLKNNNYSLFLSSVKVKDYYSYVPTPEEEWLFSLKDKKLITNSLDGKYSSELEFGLSEDEKGCSINMKLIGDTFIIKYYIDKISDSLQYVTMKKDLENNKYFLYLGHYNEGENIIIMN